MLHMHEPEMETYRSSYHKLKVHYVVLGMKF